MKARKPRGYKLTGERSLDMCPCCIRFGCDPFGGSLLFRQKVDERRRMGLCPSCGKPKAYCSCKSSLSLKGNVHTIKTHNNKKLRKAMAEIKAREAMYLLWVKNEDLLTRAFGDDPYDDLAYAFHRHQRPKMPYDQFHRVMLYANLNPEPFAIMWNVPTT